MRQAPYDLDWGASVSAIVKVTNAYGSSLTSDAGNGAVILTDPDTPVLLVEDYSKRTATTLGFSWQDGAENGGSPILDYKISYD